MRRMRGGRGGRRRWRGRRRGPGSTGTAGLENHRLRAPLARARHGRRNASSKPLGLRYVKGSHVSVLWKRRSWRRLRSQRWGWNGIGKAVSPVCGRWLLARRDRRGIWLCRRFAGRCSRVVAISCLGRCLGEGGRRGSCGSCEGRGSGGGS